MRMWSSALARGGAYALLPNSIMLSVMTKEMDVSEEIRGELERTGSALFEVYSVRLASERSPGESGGDLSEVLKRFLEERGFEVNSIRPVGEGSDPSERRPECRMWHEQYPNHSNWFYDCL